MGPAAEKGPVSTCLQSGLGDLPVLDTLFANNPLPPGTACPGPLVLQLFPLIYPLLARSYAINRCVIRLLHARAMEADISLITTIALGADYYWTSRTLWVRPTVPYVLRKEA